MSLIILVGVPGSGKSTLAEKLVHPSCICEADTYPGLYVKGVLQPHLLSKAHHMCQSNVLERMKARVPTIVQSNTNLDIKSVTPYINMAKQYGYHVKIQLPHHGLFHYMNDLDREEQFNELCRLRSKGDKCIPVHVMKRLVDMYDASLSTFIPLTSLTHPDDFYNIL